MDALCVKKMLGPDTLTHKHAFKSESFCSKDCAEEHYWKAYASDSWLGLV